MQLTSENVLDLRMWENFLNHPSGFYRPFMDVKIVKAKDISFYTDASKNPLLGAGGWCKTRWFSQQWEPGFIEKFNPSIAYLELFAVMARVYLWLKDFKNMCILLHCDNQSVVFMINNSSSKCRNCMVLIRLLTIFCMKNNIRLYAQFVDTHSNEIANALSCLQMDRFKKLTKKFIMKNKADKLPELLWPMSKLWRN